MISLNAVTAAHGVMGDDNFRDALDAVEARYGVAFLSSRIVYLGVPVDEDMDALPLHVFDGPGERGLLVLFIAGDMALLPGHLSHFRELGFTHIVWKRGFKPGTQRWRRAPLDQWSKKFLSLHGQRRAGH